MYFSTQEKWNGQATVPQQKLRGYTMEWFFSSSLATEHPVKHLAMLSVNQDEPTLSSDLQQRNWGRVCRQDCKLGEHPVPASLLVGPSSSAGGTHLPAVTWQCRSLVISPTIKTHQVSNFTIMLKGEVVNISSKRITGLRLAPLCLPSHQPLYLTFQLRFANSLAFLL